LPDLSSGFPNMSCTRHIVLIGGSIIILDFILQ
jgi:hypothetical protein